MFSVSLSPVAVVIFSVAGEVDQSDNDISTITIYNTIIKLFAYKNKIYHYIRIDRKLNTHSDSQPQMMLDPFMVSN